MCDEGKTLEIVADVSLRWKVISSDSSSSSQQQQQPQQEHQRLMCQKTLTGAAHNKRREKSTKIHTTVGRREINKKRAKSLLHGLHTAIVTHYVLHTHYCCYTTDFFCRRKRKFIERAMSSKQRKKEPIINSWCIRKLFLRNNLEKFVMWLLKGIIGTLYISYLSFCAPRG